MERRTHWVLLAYRLPREPSTPRIGLWRQLRRLGVGQIADGVVALPLDARTREHFDWLAQEVIDHGGEAAVWLAEPGSAAQERALATAMTTAVDAEYERVVHQAETQVADSDAVRRRTVERLRRELRRIASRDYFPSGMGDRARAAVETLGRSLEAVS
jgi:hypothetical protein